MAKTDTYKEVITYNFPGAIVKVSRPELDPQERERRMAIIRKAAAELLKG